jgi:NhaP-type Na+/H+ or K+/H+ antiporter
MEETWRQINSTPSPSCCSGRCCWAGAGRAGLDWRIAAYTLASATVVRMLPVALAMTGTGMRRATVAFLGWFGPRGLASIVLLLILLEETELPERPLMAAVVTWTEALSVYAHGLTAGPAATRYADWYDAPASSIVSCPRVPSWPSNAWRPALHQQREARSSCHLILVGRPLITPH